MWMANSGLLSHEDTSRLTTLGFQKMANAQRNNAGLASQLLPCVVFSGSSTQTCTSTKGSILYMCRQTNLTRFNNYKCSFRS